MKLVESIVEVDAIFITQEPPVTILNDNLSDESGPV